MTDRLVELIAKYFKKLNPNSNYIIATQLAGHLRNNGVTLQQWIPVSERLPEEWEDVLVVCEAGFIEVAVYLGECGKGVIPWRVSWNHEFLEMAVTHWMPLPEPPKGVDHDTD